MHGLLNEGLRVECSSILAPSGAYLQLCSVRLRFLHSWLGRASGGHGAGAAGRCIEAVPQARGSVQRVRTLWGSTSKGKLDDDDDDDDDDGEEEEEEGRITCSASRRLRRRVSTSALASAKRWESFLQVAREDDKVEANAANMHQGKDAG
jgi:hypothetical protein